MAKEGATRSPGDQSPLHGSLSSWEPSHPVLPWGSCEIKPPVPLGPHFARTPPGAGLPYSRHIAW